MVKGVIFDLFGTLVEEVNRHEGPEFGVVAEALGTSHEALATAWVETSLERDRGDDGDFPNYVAHLARRLRLSPSSAAFERAVEEWRGIMRKDLMPRADALVALARLRASGIKVGLLTNCNADMPVRWVETPFPPHFDATVFSAAVRLVKPDPRIFQLALDGLGLRAEECLFVGDGGSDELSGATKMGMTAVLVPRSYPSGAFRFTETEWTGLRVERLAGVADLVTAPTLR